MNRFIIALPLAFVFASCGPKPQPAEETKPAAVTVAKLAVETNDHKMTVAWQKQGSGAISGYNVYIANEAADNHKNQDDVKPYNDVPFPGDTNPDDGIEHYVAGDLENGVKYHVWVRVVYPDGSLSAPTGEMTAMCGPKGEIELDYRHKGDHDGFSFEQNEYVDASSIDNDVYFYAIDGVDYLASPSRLDGFINHSQLIVVKLAGDYEALTRSLMTNKVTPTDDRAAVKARDWVLVKTQRGSYALLHVLSFSGEGEKRRVKLSYAYHVIVGDSQT